MYSALASQFHCPYDYPLQRTSQAPEVLGIRQCIPSTSNLSPFTTGDYFDNMAGLPIFYFPPVIASQLIKGPALKFYFLSVFYTNPEAKYFGFDSMIIYLLHFDPMIRDSACRRYIGEWSQQRDYKKVKESLGWYSSVDWIPAREPKDCKFNSQSGPYAWVVAEPLVGDV